MFVPFVLIRGVLQVEAEADWDYDQLIAAAVLLFLRGALETQRDK